MFQSESTYTISESDVIIDFFRCKIIKLPHYYPDGSVLKYTIIMISLFKREDSMKVSLVLQHYMKLLTGIRRTSF